MKRILVLTALAACAADNDAARLDHPRILAVRSTPAHAEPGEAVRIDVLAGDTAGAAMTTAPDVVNAGPLEVEHRADGWYVIAPAMPIAPTVEIELVVDGERLRASKQLVFGDHADNPTVTTMQVDGTDAQSIACSVGATRELAVIGAGVEPFGFAWYSSIGSLDHDRTARATFTADTAGEGIVLVVVRDAQGGVAWQQAPTGIR